MDSATWCRTPAADSAARRLRPEVSKNSSTALSSNEGELARSITTSAPAMASLRPSPVMVLTPLLGEAAMTSRSPWRRIATVFEPIRPVPPITTIFIAYPHLLMLCKPRVSSDADIGANLGAPYSSRDEELARLFSYAITQHGPLTVLPGGVSGVLPETPHMPPHPRV